MSHQPRFSYRTIPLLLGARLSTGALALGALLLTQCDSPEEDRAILQTEDSKVGQPREGYEATGDASPLTPPNRFLRTDFELKAAAHQNDDLEVKVNVEEVTAGLRVSVIVRNADPERYRVVFHESGACDGKAALGPVLDLMAPKTLGSDGVQRSDWERALGDVEVKADGDGRGLWLTGWGNLRERDDKSVLNRPLALYRALPGDKLGDVVACAPITMN